MRKCHHIYDKKIGKVLIPYCWPVVISNDMSNCCCRKENQTFKQFESKEFNKTLKEKLEYIQELEKENAKLLRILRKVNGFK